MTDPRTSMSLPAILVLTVVALVLVVGWLAAVFLAGRQPGGGGAQPGSEGSARARRPETVTHAGDVIAPAPGTGQDG